MLSEPLIGTKENNIPVIGHIPLITPEAFYHSGQKEIAHIEEITKKIWKI
jgi:hypothetical protein